MIRFFLDRGAKYTVLKMGEQDSSIAWLENGRINEIRFPCFKAPVVDFTGCGDSYCAGFIMGLSMGWDLEKAADSVLQPAAWSSRASVPTPVSSICNEGLNL